MTNGVLPPITHPTHEDAVEIASLISTAFADLPPVAWLVPDPRRRHAVIRDQFAILVEHALLYGHVDLLADRSGAAVWFDNTRGAPPPSDYERRLRAACGPDTPRFQLLDALFEANHPREPHHHLVLLGVLPEHQGKGRGSALLCHHQSMLDRIGVPAYLEASSARSRNLYLRNDFRPQERFELPDGTPFYPMWRTPKG